METLAGILASAVGAAIAGFLGVQFGFLKTRRERAFDRRLAWYEGAVSRTEELRRACLGIAYALENNGSVSDETRRLAAFSEGFPAWHSSMAVAPLYASASTAQKTTASTDRIGEMLRPHGGGVALDLTAIQLELVAQVLSDLLEALIADGRRHLTAE